MAVNGVWWWVVPTAEAGDSSRPANAKLITTPTNGAEYTAFMANGSYAGYNRFQGPFTSQAAAKAANPSGGSTGQVIGAGISAGAAGDSAVGGAIGAGVSAVGAAQSAISSVTGFLSTLGSANLWIRVVKVIAGSIILFIGVAHLTGLDQKITGIAGKAVSAAPLLA